MASIKCYFLSAAIFLAAATSAQKKCPGEHEFFDCGSECDNVCSTIRTQNRTNCPYVNIKCNEKCYCQDGYARDGNNKCIPVARCRTEETKHVCKPNEVYIDCAPPCPPDTCLSLVAKFNCAPNRPCQPGCKCRSGYLRRTAGAPCRPTKYCPQLANSSDAY